MKAIIALTILIAVASASMVSQRDIDTMMESNWGKIFLNMAQLQIQSGGPIEDLVREIENLATNNQQKLDAATDAFDRRTAQHEETVRLLNGKISDAASGIANTKKLISETLIPQKKAMEDGIAQAKATIKANNQYISDATLQRKIAQEEYEAKIANANEAAAAIDQALSVLSQLGEDETSLIQLKAAQKNLKKATEKLAKGGSEAWISALVQIAQANYANSEAIRKVQQLLNDVKNNILDHISNETAANDKAIENFKNEVASREAQNRQNEADIVDYSDKLQQTIQAIQDSHDLIGRLEVDLRSYQDQLAEENLAYENATKAYNNLKAQYEAEIAACGQAVDVLRRGIAGMADYIKQRTDEGISPLTSAHGQKMNVYDYDV